MMTKKNWDEIKINYVYVYKDSKLIKSIRKKERFGLKNVFKVSYFITNFLHCFIQSNLYLQHSFKNNIIFF